MKSILKAVIIIFLFTNVSYAHVNISEVELASEVTLNDNEALFPLETLTDMTAINLSKEAHNFNTLLTINSEASVTLDNYYWDNTNGKSKRFIRGEQGNQFVGELYGGGIIFYFYENKGGSKGLIG